jgi:regulator of protease activity HflC (stomatin/prohibitin superfamily)
LKWLLSFLELWLTSELTNKQRFADAKPFDSAQGDSLPSSNWLNNQWLCVTLSGVEGLSVSHLFITHANQLSVGATDKTKIFDSFTWILYLSIESIFISNQPSVMTLLSILLVLAVIIIYLSVVIVQQGTVAVITIFGKYARVMGPGLNFKIPFIEVIYRRISIQNRSVELAFQAITADQANVNFKAMLVYSVLNQQEETIKNVAFKFIDEASFMQALIRTIEGSIRSFVATKRQSEILSLRSEIIEHVKAQLDTLLESWGYHLTDLQLNDIAFDEVIMRSMAQVVASSNLRAAAENEGQALLITKTKSAEAEGNAIKISAEAEKTASQLRGQGVALFREEVAKGMAESAKVMTEANLDASLILFSIWTEAIKHFAENGQGNVIFLDGSTEGMEKTMRQLLAVEKMNTGGSNGNRRIIQPAV